MRKFLEWIKQEESGQGMVEYAIIVGLVVMIAIVVFNGSGTEGGLGDKIKALFDGIGDEVENATPK